MVRSGQDGPNSAKIRSAILRSSSLGHQPIAVEIARKEREALEALARRATAPARSDRRDRLDGCRYGHHADRLPHGGAAPGRLPCEDRGAVRDPVGRARQGVRLGGEERDVAAQRVIEGPRS